MHPHTYPAGPLASLPTFPLFQCLWQHLVCGYLRLVPKIFIFKALLSPYLQSTVCLLVSSPLSGCTFVCVHLTRTNQQVTRVRCSISSLGCAALPPGAAVSLLHLQLCFNSLVPLYCQDHLEPRLQPNLSQKSSNSTILQQMPHPLSPHFCEITNTNSLASLTSSRLAGLILRDIPSNVQLRGIVTMVSGGLPVPLYLGDRNCDESGAFEQIDLLQSSKGRSLLEPKGPAGRSASRYTSTFRII